MKWRDKVDPILKHHLEKEIQESNSCKKAYISAKDPGKAQLWCAIANLSKKIFDLNLKVSYLEGVLKDSLKKTSKRKFKKEKK